MKVYKSSWNPANGEVLQAYVHGQTHKGSGVGKIGSFIHLSRKDNQVTDELEVMASSLSMHIAAMKPAYMKIEDVPEEHKKEIMEREDGGEKALKKFIKRDVLWE